MKKLLLSEFKDYCVENNFKKFIFLSDNQIKHNTDVYMHISFEFDVLKITFNPNIIYMQSGNNTMRLNKVKLIRVSEEPSLLGTVVTVVCGDSSNKNNDREYVLVMR